MWDGPQGPSSTDTSRAWVMEMLARRGPGDRPTATEAAEALEPLARELADS